MFFCATEGWLCHDAARLRRDPQERRLSDELESGRARQAAHDELRSCLGHVAAPVRCSVVSVAIMLERGWFFYSLRDDLAALARSLGDYLRRGRSGRGQAPCSKTRRRAEAAVVVAGSRRSRARRRRPPKRRWPARRAAADEAREAPRLPRHARQQRARSSASSARSSASSQAFDELGKAAKAQAAQAAVDRSPRRRS